MPSAATVTSLIAIAACAVGALVALDMWRQRRRAARARRFRHPSSPPPVTIALDGTDAALRWRLEVAPDAPPTGVDIVSWRPANSSAAWTGEAIVQPIEIGPGGWALTPSELPASDAYDVVVAWTSHSEAGDLQGSRTLRIDGRPTPRGTVATVAPTRSPLGWPVAEMVLAGVLVVCVIVVAALWAGSDPIEDVPVASPTTTPATSVVVTTAVATTAPPNSVATTTTAASTSPTTTVATIAPPTTRPLTRPPTTVPGPSIDVTGTIDQCAAGPNCLVASFTIEGFDTPPTSYVCEFADGERITFDFGGDTVVRACSTGSAGASITIEIDGVRSNTVTRDDAA